MNIPAPYTHTAIVHGGAGDDDLVDQANLASIPHETGGAYRGTYLYGHEGNDTFMGESGLGENRDYGGIDLFDGGSGTDMVFYGQSNAGMVVDLAYDPSFGRAYAIGYSTDIGPFDNGRVDFLVSIEDIYGSIHADLLSGSSIANYLAGLDGNDEIDGRGGNDTLHGNAGNDTILGGSGNDEIHGDEGNDDLFGGSGQDLILGGAGNDDLYGGDQNDVLYGNDGFNRLYGNDGNDTLLIGQDGEGYGQDGNDIIVGGNADEKLDGGPGSDTLNGMGGNDLIIGGPDSDVIDGGAGIDTGDFSGMWGTTVVFNAIGSGLVIGPASTDSFQNLEIFRLGNGSDSFLGNSAANNASLGGGNDYAYGADGNDTFDGQGGNDTLHGQDGNDTLVGGAGNDALHGGEGNDAVYGSDGNDQLYGEDGNDTLNGGNGNDTLEGGAGNDVIQANGNDIIIGGVGDDTINLMVGDQQLRWLSGHTGFDTVNGFNPYHDQLVFSRSFFAGGVTPIDLEEQLFVAASGNDVWLYANTAATGWTAIAVFHDVPAALFDAGIEDGTMVSLIGTDFGFGF